MSYEDLKSEIAAGVSAKEIVGEWFTLNEEYIDETVINRALAKHRRVYIPYIGFPIVLHNPIIMSSDMHLRVDAHQIMMQGKESRACLLRNEHVQDGHIAPVSNERIDKRISLEGGI